MSSLARHLPLTLFAAIALAVGAPTVAWATSVAGNGGSSNRGYPVGGGGSGGSTGPIDYWELKNTDKDSLPYNAKMFDQWRTDEDDLGANAEKLTKFLHAPCNSSHHDPKCVLWYDHKEASSDHSADSPAWYEIHTLDPDGQQAPVSPGVLAGYQVKIWRERPAFPADEGGASAGGNKGGLDLIFERRVARGNAEADPQPNQLSAEDRANFWGDAIQRRWWFGGNTDKPGQGSFENKGKSAGMVGAPWTVSMAHTCTNRFYNGDNGKREMRNGKLAKSFARQGAASGNDLKYGCYWEGDDIGPDYFRWGASSGTTEMAREYERPGFGDTPGHLPNDQFGPAGGVANGKPAIQDKGLKEAIYFQWSNPGTTHGRNSFSFRIDGAPGIFYVVQVVGIDTREQIIPFASAHSTDWQITDGQFFAGYLPNPLPQCNSDSPDWNPQRHDCSSGGGCEVACEPHIGEPHDFSDSEPTLTARLSAATPLQTHEYSHQTLQVTPTDGLDGYQALFPTLATMTHFTPQVLYSSSKLADPTYPGDYVSYGPERRGASIIREPSPLNPGRMLVTNNQDPRLQQARMRSAAWIDPVSGSASYNDPARPDMGIDFPITWLRPTLNNPCWADQLTPEQGGPSKWPTDLQQCPSDANGNPTSFNAWDDLLTGSLDWEARWVGGSVKDKDAKELGRIQQQSLRCAGSGQGIQPAPSQVAAGGVVRQTGQPVAQQCSNDMIPLPGDVVNRDTQYAQGYFLSAAADSTARARIILDITPTLEDNLRSLDLYQRGTSAIYQFAPQKNTISGNYEINACKQGLVTQIGNDKAEVLPANGNVSKIRDVKDSEAGNDECRGWVVKWQWSDSSACLNNPPDPNDFVSTLSRNPGNAKLPHPREGMYANDDLWGDINGESGRRAYDPFDFKGAPFVGGFPGTPGSFAGGRCDGSDQGTQKDDYRQNGKWVIARDADIGWGENNSTGPLPSGSVDGMGYNVNAVFSGLQQHDFDAGAAWRLRASYEGFPNLIWFFHQASTPPGADGLSDYIKVFAPRNDR